MATGIFKCVRSAKEVIASKFRDSPMGTNCAWSCMATRWPLSSTEGCRYMPTKLASFTFPMGYPWRTNTARHSHPRSSGALHHDHTDQRHYSTQFGPRPAPPSPLLPSAAHSRLPRCRPNQMTPLHPRHTRHRRGCSEDWCCIPFAGIVKRMPGPLGVPLGSCRKRPTTCARKRTNSN